MSITVIGDVHGKYSKYLELTKQHDNTVQLGDFGFNYDALSEVDYDRHLLFSGNHDNIDKLLGIPHDLGDYGQAVLNGIPFFFVRGGYSIDAKIRKIGIDWFANEEMSFQELMDCVEFYKQVKPDIVISHEAPSYVSRLKGDVNMLVGWGLHPLWSSRTGQALQQMFHIHTPKLWIHGHLHTSYQEEILGCKFVGLNELETFIVEKV